MSKNFGELIRIKRQESPESIATLCDKAGISKSYLMDIEKGRARSINLKMLKSLCKALVVSEDEVKKLKSPGISFIIEPKTGAELCKSIF